MAELQGVISTQIRDSRTEVTSYDQPVKFADTNTLAAIVTAVQGFGASVDTITDGQLTKIRFCLFVPLPSGIKSSPVAGSDNEKTGLATWDVAGSANSYGVDTPAIPNSLLTGNQIITGTGAYAAFISLLQSVGTLDFTDRYGNSLGVPGHAVLTFRKHRRALRRA